MARPKSPNGPKRKQPHLWSVGWGPELDKAIEEKQAEIKRTQKIELSKTQVVKMLVAEGLAYVKAAEKDPSLKNKVEELVGQDDKTIETTPTPEIISVDPEMIRKNDSETASKSKRVK